MKFWLPAQKQKPTPKIHPDSQWWLLSPTQPYRRIFSSSKLLLKIRGSVSTKIHDLDILVANTEKIHSE